MVTAMALDMGLFYLNILNSKAKEVSVLKKEKRTGEDRSLYCLICFTMKNVDKSRIIFYRCCISPRGSFNPVSFSRENCNVPHPKPVFLCLMKGEHWKCSLPGQSLGPGSLLLSGR